VKIEYPLKDDSVLELFHFHIAMAFRRRQTKKKKIEKRKTKNLLTGGRDFRAPEMK